MPLPKCNVHILNQRTNQKKKERKNPLYMCYDAMNFINIIVIIQSVEIIYFQLIISVCLYTTLFNTTPTLPVINGIALQGYTLTWTYKFSFVSRIRHALIKFPINAFLLFHSFVKSFYFSTCGFGINIFRSRVISCIFLSSLGSRHNTSHFFLSSSPPP